MRKDGEEQKREPALSGLLQRKPHFPAYRPFVPRCSQLHTPQKLFFKIDIDKEFYGKIYGKQIA